MNIYESAENYLEAILSLHERHGLVRSIDIANELHFSKPSVSVAMKKLRESGYIEMDKDGFISLLPSGEEIARRIYERHKLLTQFFIRLGVDPEVAAADACKVEHDLAVLGPGAHPLAVAPAVRAEQADGFAAQAGLYRLEHGLKFGLFQLLGAHRRAAEGQRAVAGNQIGAELAGGEQVGLAARALRHKIGHGLGVAGAAPVNDCDLTHD